MTVGELVQAIRNFFISMLEAIEHFFNEAYNNVMTTKIADIVFWPLLATSLVAALVSVAFLNSKYEERKRAP